MTCDRIENLLPLYLEGEVTPEEKAAVEEHLRLCPSCSSLLNLLRETQETLAGFPEISPSRTLMARLYAIPEKKKKISPVIDFFLRPALQPVFAVATVFLTLFSFYLFHPDRQQINRAISRQFHRGYNQVEKLIARAGAFTESLNGEKENLIVSLRSKLERNGE